MALLAVVTAIRGYLSGQIGTLSAVSTSAGMDFISKLNELNFVYIRTSQLSVVSFNFF